MICPRCGNAKAYFLTEDDTCNRCQDSYVKPKKQVKKRGPYKQHMIGNPVYAIGVVTGVRRWYKSARAAADKYGITVRTVRNICRGHGSGRNIGWRFEYAPIQTDQSDRC